MMFYRSRIYRLEMEVISLRASINHLLEITNALMVARADHPDVEEQTRRAKNLVGGKGWRIAQNWKAIDDAKDLQRQLQVMAEDYPVVAEMLAKEKE
jgi:hypothetical protein